MKTLELITKQKEFLTQLDKCQTEIRNSLKLADSAPASSISKLATSLQLIEDCWLNANEILVQLQEFDMQRTDIPGIKS